MSPVRAQGRDEAGFTLLEAMVAMLIVALYVVAYIGIRTSALVDATRARNWRLAREIAEEKLSELQAGARETPPESGLVVPIDRYKDFSYKIVLGESAVSELESEVATEAAGDNDVATERIEWQRDREDYRRASERGLSRQEYEEQQFDDINARLAEKAPSVDDFEEVAVVVYFPKLDPDYEGQQEALLIKSRVSTLAISGMTPEQAEALANAQNGGNNGSAPAGGAAPGGNAPVNGGGR